MNAVSVDSDLHLRPMRESDVSEVVRIEKRAYFDAWSKRYFHSCLHDDTSCWVLEQGDVIYGYGVMAVTEGRAHIMNLCVRPDLQGQGLGRNILNHLLSEADRHGVDAVTLEVSVANDSARHLYRSLGFVDTGKSNTYYMTRTGWEDTLVMTRQLK